MLVAETVDVLAVEVGFEGMVARRHGSAVHLIPANRVLDLLSASKRSLAFAQNMSS